MIFGERYLISWITVMEKRSTVDNTMILFDRVTKTYGTGQKALDDVSLQIEKGEFVFLVGNSGAGKTTLLELILRETEADQGNIVVNGIDLRQLKERQVCRYRRYIGMVFQDFCLFRILRSTKMWHLPSVSSRRTINVCGAGSWRS